MADKSETRKELEVRAAKVGLDYPHNIGDAKLEERVQAAEAAAQGAGGQDAGGDTSPASTEPEPPAEVDVYEIKGPKKGRRRAGRHFGIEPVMIPADELTEDDLEALEADPLITVVLRKADT